VAWPDRSAGWALTFVAVALLCAAPAWLFGDQFDGFRLKLDDFVYVAEARTREALVENLWKPHNAHVVPLFRLATFGLVTLAGDLGRLPAVLGWATYGVLVLTMIATGAFVARESRRVVLGVAAMAGLGLSTCLEPAVSWYAAGQALWAALAVVLMLMSLQAWRRRGSVCGLVAGGLAAASAPLLWSGGYAAGPVGLIYLWADGRAGSRKAALVPLAAVLLTGLVVVSVAGRRIVAAQNSRERPARKAVYPLRAVSYTAQAVPEFLVLRNLGIDAATTAPQGAALCLALLGAWAWSRGAPCRANPLEASGAALAVSSFLLVYAARGYEEFDSLRGLGWYQMMPQVGAVIFASGWWAGRPGASAPPPPLRAPTRGGLLAVLALASALFVLQTPLAEARLLGDVYPLSESERERLPTRKLQRLRARYLTSEVAARQERFLARLDGAERAALRLGVGRDAIRRAFGRVVGPGMPEHVTDLDASDLMALPREGRPLDPVRVRSALADWLATEPQPRPAWLRPGEPWPPKPSAER
jgi:hypothetical protein